MKKRMGRPPGREYGDLIHIRIPQELRERMDSIRGLLPDRPSMAVYVRQAIVEAIRRDERRND